MRGWFGSKHSCCDSCSSCGSCGSCGGEVIHQGTPSMPKAGEQIPAPSNPPKKMPGGDKKAGLPQTLSAEPIAAPASPRPLDLGQSPY